MQLNITLPGMGGGSTKKQKVEPKPIVKRRYWTPDPNDETVYKGQPGMQGEAPADYNEKDAYYADKVWDKKAQTWVKATDDIYRTNDAGEQLLWQPKAEPQKKGLLK